MKGSLMNIYVGNLSFRTTEKELQGRFETFGVVKSAKIVTDGYTGKSKGFGYVEMPDLAEGKAAIAGMNGKELDRSPLKVNEAKPRQERSNRTRIH
jgi:RNA recognition motif-containing protein